jgi:hypothetical protein
VPVNAPPICTRLYRMHCTHQCCKQVWAHLLPSAHLLWQLRDGQPHLKQKKKNIKPNVRINIMWRTLKLLDGLTTSPKVKTSEGEGVGVRSLARSTLEVKGHVGALGLGLGQLISSSIIHTNLQKPNKLVSA